MLMADMAKITLVLSASISWPLMIPVKAQPAAPAIRNVP